MGDTAVIAKERARRETFDRPMCGMHAAMRGRPEFDFDHRTNGSAIGCKRLQDASDWIIDFRLDSVFVLLIPNDWKEIRAESQLDRERLVTGLRIQRVDGHLLDLTVRILRVE